LDRNDVVRLEVYDDLTEARDNPGRHIPPDGLVVLTEIAGEDLLVVGAALGREVQLDGDPLPVWQAKLGIRESAVT
jgi:hypothetical protein